MQSSWTYCLSDSWKHSTHTQTHANPFRATAGTWYVNPAGAELIDRGDTEVYHGGVGGDGSFVSARRKDYKFEKRRRMEWWVGRRWWEGRRNKAGRNVTRWKWEMLTCTFQFFFNFLFVVYSKRLQTGEESMSRSRREGGSRTVNKVVCVHVRVCRVERCSLCAARLPVSHPSDAQSESSFRLTSPSFSFFFFFFLVCFLFPSLWHIATRICSSDTAEP